MPTISLYLNILLTLVSFFGLGKSVVKIPWPQKWVWIVGFSIMFATGLCNALYQHGGVYLVLLPALFPFQAAVETTATLAFVIASYSAIHGNQINSHFYSLPTGCTPIAMLAQYFPTIYIQIAFVAIVTVLARLNNKAKEFGRWVLPLGLLVGSTSVSFLGYKFPPLNLSCYDLSSILLILSTLLFALLCTGEPIAIGKFKIA